MGTPIQVPRRCNGTTIGVVCYQEGQEVNYRGERITSVKLFSRQLDYPACSLLTLKISCCTVSGDPCVCTCASASASTSSSVLGLGVAGAKVGGATAALNLKLLAS